MIVAFARRVFFRNFAVSLMLLFGSGASPGASDPRSERDARSELRGDERALRVVERGLEAAGGRERLSRVRWLESRSRIRSNTGFEGETQDWFQSDGKRRIEFTGVNVHQRIVVNGGRVDRFFVDATSEVKGAEREDLLRRRWPWPEMRAEELGLTFEWIGEEELPSGRASKIRTRDAGGHVTVDSYDNKTGRLARRVEDEAVTMDGVRAEVSIEYSQYQEYDGVWLPVELRRRVREVLVSVSTAWRRPETAPDASLWNVNTVRSDEALLLYTIPKNIFRETCAEHVLHDEVNFRISAPNLRLDDGSQLLLRWCSGGEEVQSQRYARGPLAAMRDVASGESKPSEFLIHQQFPKEIDADELRIEIVESPGGRKVDITKKLIAYETKTELSFPLRVPAIVTAGHRAWEHHAAAASQSYAYDLLVCDSAGKHLREGARGNRNEDFIGYGEDVLAPAAGTIVYVRNDWPENASPGSLYSPETYLLELSNVAGNAVVIDHGAGEYSLLAHLRTGSVAVKMGEKVARGAVIGKLGNSGHSTGPHLHFQLMDGPLPHEANGLPARFRNLVDLQFERRLPFLKTNIAAKPTGGSASKPSAESRPAEEKESRR